MKTLNLYCRLLSLTAALVISFLLNEGRAQSLDFPPLEDTRFGIEIMKGNFKDVEGISTLSSILYLDIQAPLASGKLAFLAEVPMAIYDQDDIQTMFGTFSYEAQTLIGNPL